MKNKGEQNLLAFVFLFPLVGNCTNARFMVDLVKSSKARAQNERR